jgi:hypothetical protein
VRGWPLPLPAAACYHVRMAQLSWPTLAPLFWQHGEPHDVLRAEMRGMHAAGIRAFILESRPHPDFAGPRWWSDLDAIVAEAKPLGMQVWIFDDKVYPTGFANGAIRASHPELGKRFLRRERIEAIGPLSGASFRVGAWCASGETLLATVAGRLTDDGGTIDPSSLTDMTSAVHDGVLYWDVPAGRWRVYVIVVARTGGEEWTKDYLNPLDPAATRVLLDAVYEPHYARYGDEFGRTIAGFFSDEPRFGNAGTYDARIGRYPMVLPWRDGMLERLSAAWGGSFIPHLPCLWDEAGHPAARARVAYMDLVSRLYADGFSRPIGDWCRSHGARYIGHVVEDNGAHTRLGYGAGHFFRALAGQDASGFDLVYQVWPGHADGRYLTPFGDLDARFFTWGIAKLASSAAHLDPLKNGATACEIFGAYGWRLGLRMMKWLTDHACVRGANLLIPHAFSPKEFPDPDCPPHFRARGMNPQWRHFGVWSAYADRVCRALSDGVHVASAAVLYHAEAEWSGGAYEPFEAVVRDLAMAQIDCDVVPADTLLDGAVARFEGRTLAIGKERFGLIVVPYAEMLPSAVLRRLLEAARAGVPVVFCRAYPRACIDDEAERDPRLAALRRHRRVRALPVEVLAAAIRRRGLHDVEASPAQPHLRVYHYRKDERDTWFLVNESVREPVETALTLRGCTARVTGYDALHDRALEPQQRATRAGTAVEIRLEPFESLFLFADPAPADPRSIDRAAPPISVLAEIDGPWEISIATASEYPSFTPAPALKGPGNVAVPGLLPGFSGTLRYECRFTVPRRPDTGTLLDIGEAFETVEVWLNGSRLGVRICPPYRFDAGGLLAEAENELVVEVTNTLVHSHGENGLDRAMPVDPSGLIGPVRLLG